MTPSHLPTLIFLLALFSCKPAPNPPIETYNDTTFLLNQSLNDALSIRYMPDASSAKRPYVFNDSILLTSRVIPLDLLPASVGNQHFKIMPEPDILRILRADSGNREQPNYLVISSFEANDSGYYVQVESRSAWPFGGGGSLGMYYIKKGDSSFNVQRYGSSIN